MVLPICTECASIVQVNKDGTYNCYCGKNQKVKMR
jgi:hypothetical protein